MGREAVGNGCQQDTLQTDRADPTCVWLSKASLCDPSGSINPEHNLVSGPSPELHTEACCRATGFIWLPVLSGLLNTFWHWRKKSSKCSYKYFAVPEAVTCSSSHCFPFPRDILASRGSLLSIEVIFTLQKVYLHFAVNLILFSSDALS